MSETPLACPPEAVNMDGPGEPAEDQRAIDVEVRATRKAVLTAYDARLRADPLVLADMGFLTLADRHVVRSAIVVAALGAGADACLLQTYDPVSRTLRIARHRGLGRAFLHHYARVDASAPAACAQVLRSGRQVLVDDVASSVVFTGQPTRALMLDGGSRAVHAYPLRDRQANLIGVLSLHFRTAGARRAYTKLAQAAARALSHTSRPLRAGPPGPPGLTINRTGRSDGVTLELEGSLDVHSVPACRAALAAELRHLRAGSDLIVDLTHLDYLGVAGARALLDAADECARRRLPFHLVTGPDHDVRMVFERIGVTTALRALDESAFPIRGGLPGS
jgi:anti-anti-sigma factor